MVPCMVTGDLQHKFMLTQKYYFSEIRFDFKAIIILFQEYSWREVWSAEPVGRS